MAQRGQKPKPTKLHEMHGTGNATRMKARAKEPQPEGAVGPPPAHLSDDQKAAWDYAVANAPEGVLFACDRGALEVFIVAADHHRIANEEQQKLDGQEGQLRLLVTTNETRNRKGEKTGGGNIIQSPYLGIMSTAGARMLRASAELGFTPASRPRIMAGGDFDPAMPGKSRLPGPAPKPRGEKSEMALDRLMKDRASLN